jgi:putative acetyltransferase
MDSQQHERKPRANVSIRPFQPGDEAPFRRLNEEWIKRYFRIEPKDEEAFANPQQTILDPGGQIFFATMGEKCVGCVALLQMGGGEFEVAKMAVSPAHQGGGIGHTLLQAAIDAARASGAKKLYLETNHTLTPAIRLYESVGFKHVSSAEVTPSPYERADVHMEMILD